MRGNGHLPEAVLDQQTSRSREGGLGIGRGGHGTHCLVLEPPLGKIGLRQLGWWKHLRYGEMKNVPNHQPEWKLVDLIWFEENETWSGLIQNLFYGFLVFFVRRNVLSCDWDKYWTPAGLHMFFLFLGKSVGILRSRFDAIGWWLLRRTLGLDFQSDSHVATHTPGDHIGCNGAADAREARINND